MRRARFGDLSPCGSRRAVFGRNAEGKHAPSDICLYELRAGRCREMQRIVVGKQGER